MIALFLLAASASASADADFFKAFELRQKTSQDAWQARLVAPQIIQLVEGARQRLGGMEPSGGVGSRRVGDIALAGAYLSLGRDADATVAIERALAHPQDDMLQVEALNLKAQLLARQGDLGAALQTRDEEVRRLKRQDSWKEKANQAFEENNYGDLYAMFGDQETALAHFVAAEALAGNDAGAQRQLAHALSEQAKIQADRGNFADALKLAKRATENAGLMSSLRKERELLTHIYIEQGDWDNAQANVIGSMTFGGMDLRAGGRLLLAEEAWDKAIDYWTRYLREVEPLRDEQLFVAYNGLGRAFLGKGAHNQALAQFQAAADILETQRASLPQALRQSFFSQKIWGFRRTEPYEGLAQTHLANKAAGEAFKSSEAIKGRVLSEALSKARDTVSTLLPPSLQARENATRAKLRDIAAEAEVAFRNDERGRQKALVVELSGAKKELDRIVAELRRVAPAYAAAHYPQPVMPSEVPLTKGEALLAYEVTATQVLAFLVRDKKLHAQALDLSRDELEAKVRTLRGAFENVRSADDLLRFDVAASADLYAALLAPFESSLQGVERLIIVPDEVLATLPFEALVRSSVPSKWGSGEHGPFPLGVSYLGDAYVISYAGSATALSVQRALKRSKSQDAYHVVVADPVFSSVDPRANGARAEPSKVALAAKAWRTMGVAGTVRKDQASAAATDDALFPRLDKTTKLAERLAGLFPQSKILLGLDARTARLREAKPEQAKYLTFATHGILDTALPFVREPALVLSQVGPADEAFLTMSQVAALSLRADVVALTACETGVGKHVSGEGVLGMGRAFQLAGAGSVLMSLWSVAEDSSTELAAAFFAAVNAGAAPSAALVTARNAVRKAGFEHPFYWSAFILSGD